jgi:hypothetical protein
MLVLATVVGGALAYGAAILLRWIVTERKLVWVGLYVLGLAMATLLYARAVSG